MMNQLLWMKYQLTAINAKPPKKFLVLLIESGCISVLLDVRKHLR